MIFDKKQQREIVKRYKNDHLSCRYIALLYGTNHKVITRVLRKNGVEITNKDRVRKPYGYSAIAEDDIYDMKNPEDKHRRYMRKLSKIDFARKHGLDEKWVLQFDLLKMKEIYFMYNNIHIPVNSDVKVKSIKEFIEHYYNDPCFNKFYDQYKAYGNKPYMKPRIIVMTPFSCGGKFEYTNFVVVPYFIYKKRPEMTDNEWESIKDYYFYDYKEPEEKNVIKWFK